MSIHKLFAILVALAVLFAPAVMSETMAAPHHDMQMSGSGRCDESPPGTHHENGMAGNSCCIGMCMAVAVVPTAPHIAHEVAHISATFTTSTLHLAYLGEIATPPPRHS